MREWLQLAACLEAVAPWAPQTIPRTDSAVLILAEAICDAQVIIAESYEEDLPDAPRTLAKLRAIFEDRAVIEALKAVGYGDD